MLIGIDASRANKRLKSGVEWYSYYLIRALSRIDSKNQYILYTNKPLRKGLADLTSKYTNEESKIEFDKQGFQIIKSAHNNFKAKIVRWPFKFLWTQGGLSLEMIFRAPDVLFIPSHVLPIIHPKKSVITIHDVGFAREKKLYARDDLARGNSFLSKLMRLIFSFYTFGKYRADSLDYLYWSTKFGLKHAKKIITISNFSKREITKYFKHKKDNIDVVYHGYNKTIFNPEFAKKNNEEILKKYDIQKPYFFYLNRIDKKKNVENLIEAFYIFKKKYGFKDYKLVMAGNASFGYDDVKYAISEYQLDNDVRLPGWIAEEDVPALFNSSIAYILPSKYEGFGMPVIQSMACGTISAVSNTASLPEIVGKASLLFDPDSPDEIAEKLNQLADKSSLKSKLVNLGFTQSSKFSWKKTAEDTLLVLEKTSKNK